MSMNSLFQKGIMFIEDNVIEADPEDIQYHRLNYILLLISDLMSYKKCLLLKSMCVNGSQLAKMEMENTFLTCH